MTKHEWALQYLAARPNENVRDAVEAWWEMERPGRASPYKAPDKPEWKIISGEVVLVMHVGDTIPDGMQGKYIRVCAV